MDGRFLISLSKAHREASGLAAGEEITVNLELVEEVRTVEIPKELENALEQSNLLHIFNNLAYSKRKEMCRQTSEAKSEETKNRRISKIIDTLKS